MQPPFSITAINPGVVTGPPINPPSHPSALNETLKPIWSILSGSATTIPAGIGSQSYIDVRDVSAIHIYAAEHPSESNGHRFLCAAGRGTMQASADILREKYPERGIVVGEPGSDYERDFRYPEGGFKFYSTRMEKALGRGLIKFDKSVLDTAEVFERYF
jgi:nucleoside-diphosphate-sugar epimerase